VTQDPTQPDPTPSPNPRHGDEAKPNNSYPSVSAAASRLPARFDLPPSARSASRFAFIIGAASLLLSLLLGYLADHSLRRFSFAYLTNFAFFLSIALGALFFVLLQHLTKAGWSVNVRRIAELLAATLPVLAILALPILFAVLANKGTLYPWARPPDDLDHLALEKRAWLNPCFFSLRIIFYFAIWSALALWYWHSSTKQDSTADPILTRRMELLSPPAMIIFALTLTFASWDLFMSLDPRWSSTIYGLYYFSGAALGCFSAIILIAFTLHRGGFLLRGITAEHYHDLGKFLFAFVFFWGYIAFSQYMLVWYASIPEEITFYRLRGATSVPADINAWTSISLLLLFGQLLIPFAALLSRHLKRRPALLAFCAAWVLVFHWLDCFWLIMPQYDTTGALHLGLIEIASLIGIGGLFLGSLLRLASRHSLRPIADPRLQESLLFENI